MITNHKEHIAKSRRENRPDGLDFIKALDTLFPYREQLMTIHVAFKNVQYINGIKFEESDSNDERSLCVDSDIYRLYNIKSLGNELLKRVYQLEMYHNSDLTYENIKLNHGTPPYRFDWHWELKEVYMYLIHVFRDNDDRMIINSIITGELLGIIECFLIRI
ncbi:MAG: hypothetical protein C4537_00405 [Acholeplasma sp.]|jgi:hypothetical protein|nr:MAG: hypothetical protein C4537_00405 [Acholeplasma sp.]